MQVETLAQYGYYYVLWALNMLRLPVVIYRREVYKNVVAYITSIDHQAC